MKKFLALAIAVFIWGIPVKAQFPATITAVWDPNPPAENITSYIFTFNGNATDILLSSCTAVECKTTFSVPSSGNHTISIRACNFWGCGEPNTLTFNASSPGKSGNLRIRTGG